MPGKLTGQVAFVTGASRGIGRNIAIELAREGANIVVAARTEEQTDPRLPGTIHSVAEQIEAMGTGARALAVRCNVADEESVAAAVEKTLAEFGHIDILINNAGIQAPSSIVDQQVRHWDLVWRVNVRGAFLCTKFIVPHMIERRQGTVINISSRAAERGAPGNVSYSISKRSLELMAEALAGEVKEYGIKSFALSPERLVITEGAQFLGLDKRLPPGTETEAPEIMGRAAVYLIADAPMELSGRSFYSQSLLREYAKV